MPEIVSDEYREGYAAFNWGKDINPYDWKHMDGKYNDWEDGWIAAQSDWIEMIGEKSV